MQDKNILSVMGYVCYFSWKSILEVIEVYNCLQLLFSNLLLTWLVLRCSTTSSIYIAHFLNISKLLFFVQMYFSVFTLTLLLI